jgi:predicted phage terminase large subunit-like protein
MRGYDARNLSEEQVAKWRIARWKARTDLEWLCQNVLNYKNVEHKYHGPVLDILQDFPAPRDYAEMCEYDQFDSGQGRWTFRPMQEKMSKLPNKRRRLILDPRSHLKTTINVQAHTIQWILNYPNIAILITQSTIDKSVAVVGEIKKHFTQNPVFRQLFPEHVPQRAINDWGTKAEFTSESRAKHITRRESTVQAASIDKGLAGYHFDVMKFSDIVEPSNTKTKTMIKSVIAGFFMMENLLVSPEYWIDVEGTRYTHNDLYGKLIEEWEKQVAAEKEPEYLVHVRSGWQKEWAREAIEKGEKPKYTPDKLDLPNFKDEDGHEVPIWPVDNEGVVRFTYEKYKSMQEKDPYIFSCQQMNNPIGGVGGLEIFAVDESRPRIISVKDYRNVRIVGTEVVVDTAETTAEGSDYTAITVGSWDAYGRLYVRQIMHGKWVPDEICKNIIAAAQYYRAGEVKIEETSFVRGLMPTMQRYMQLTNSYIPITLLKRDNQTAKTERIQYTLQPWYKQGLIVFLENVDPTAMIHVRKELKEFPLGDHDDILDTLADFFQTKTWFGRHIPRGHAQKVIDRAMSDFLGITSPYAEPDGLLPSQANVPRELIDTRTGW